MLDPERAMRAEGGLAEPHAAQEALAQLRDQLISLVRAWGGAKERYADLRSRARTPVADTLIDRIRTDIEEHESRLRKRRKKSKVKFSEAIERFVGDLLRARAGMSARPARVFHAVGKDSFKRDPVKYDMFISVLEGLKAIDLVSHLKGKARYRKSEVGVVSLPGRAARFWATGKLLGLAERYGINCKNVGEHFAPEPPLHPLVLRDYAPGRGHNKERGRPLKYSVTPETQRLEGEVRELNTFLCRFELMGGQHNGYTRVFNNNSWEKGGRLYSEGQHSYQQLPESERLKMTINGEPVAEIDIKASQLTIYHAMVGEPLKGSDDPYARAGLERSIVKAWTVISFGNGNPAAQWPEETVEEYKEDHPGKDLRKVAKASDVRRKMLDAFPALRKLGRNMELWGDLQFLEAQAVIGTMLILMREHDVPSFSMHDGIIVPRSKADLASTVLSGEFCSVVGVQPMLTVDTEEPITSVMDL